MLDMGLLLTRRLAASMALASGLAGCDSLGPDRTVVLFISELTAPTSIVEGQTLVAQVTVEFGGCRSFTKLDKVRTPGRITIRALGRDTSGPNVSCPADIRTQVVEVRTEGPFTDPFLVVGVQPTGEETKRSVRLVSR
jgi:hypothetical protein